MIIKPAPTPGDTSWFVHDRFGMFIHWGLYALAARHEWVKHHERIPMDVYDNKYFKHFDPDLYNPELWAKAAADAGMKYFVITTKHHEGFCLWDSKQTDYKATNTPAKRDLLRPMVDAYRAQNMRVGFYHSLIDWHHPEFPVDHVHPQRDDQAYIDATKDRDVSKYADYLEAQVKELLTEYGQIDLLWFDFSYGDSGKFKGKGKNEWRSERLLKIIRELQPKIAINDRLEIDQDLKTPEQYMPQEWVKINGTPVVWEGCHTFSGSWGYYRDEETWKSVEQLVVMLIDSVSKGGNLLLNVGPTGRGEFDARVLDRLSGMGEWMKRHSRSIYGCTQVDTDIQKPDNCLLTQNPDTNRLYIHILNWPFGPIRLKNMADKVEYAQLLNDASEIRMHKHDSGEIEFNLPVKKPNVTIPVLELFLKN